MFNGCRKLHRGRLSHATAQPQHGPGWRTHRHITTPYTFQPRLPLSTDGPAAYGYSKKGNVWAVRISWKGRKHQGGRFPTEAGAAGAAWKLYEKLLGSQLTSPAPRLTPLHLNAASTVLSPAARAATAPAAKGTAGAKSGTCKLIGVTQQRSGRWSARIKIPRTGRKGGTDRWLGTFDSAQEAALAYDAAAKQVKEANMQLNLPTGIPKAKTRPVASAGESRPASGNRYCSSWH
ncbi:hypothetical protein WJX73_006270 [Symbiochloris irregularis]|uniref:AP2/ERF domain-containing protein n=1 Tax=Symbiochloris irregularis TaxID=706552 RepID=A0AAW1NV54_9CHLO